MNRMNSTNRFVSAVAMDVKTSMVVAGRNGFGLEAASAYSAASHSWSGSSQVPQLSETERGIPSSGERLSCRRSSLGRPAAGSFSRLSPAGRISKRLQQSYGMPAGCN